MRVYLCGPINGCTDEECRDWRCYAKEHLRRPTLDPMRRDYRGREMEPGIAAEIVGGDKRDVAISRVILINAPKPSVGTSQEEFMAWEWRYWWYRLAMMLVLRVFSLAALRRKVIVVVHPPSPPSPWLVEHCDVLFHSMREAVEYINSLA